MAITKITKTAIERLVKKVAMQTLPQFYKSKPIRLNSLVYEEIRSIIIRFLYPVVKQSCIITDYMKKKKVSSSYVYMLLRSIPTFYHSLSSRKKCSTDKSDKDCFSFPIESFKSIIRDIAPEYTFSEHSYLSLQIYTENVISEILKMAVKILNNSKRTTLEPKDIHLAKQQVLEKYNYIRGSINRTNIDDAFNKDIQRFVDGLPEKTKIKKDCKHQIDQFVTLLLESVLSYSSALSRLHTKDTTMIDVNEVKTSIILLLSKNDKGYTTSLFKNVIDMCEEKIKKDGVNDINETVMLRSNLTPKAKKFCSVFIENIIEMIVELCIIGKSESELIITVNDLKNIYYNYDELFDIFESLGLYFDI
jgi:histone H3/H4